MARIRSIKPEFFTDDVMASLDPLDRLAFIGLWLHADREGKLPYKPRQLGVSILPYEKGDFATRISRLVTAGVLIKYAIAKETFLKIKNFAKHQKPHPTEQESVIPDPPDENVMGTVLIPCENGSLSVEERCKEGRKGKEGNGREVIARQLFATFWESYPKKRDKKKSLHYWMKLSHEEQEKASLYVPAYAEIRFSEPDQAKAAQYTCHPTTWINGARWEDLDVQRKAEEMGLTAKEAEGPR